jgi:Ca2+-binding RTX toxin-like protein
MANFDVTQTTDNGNGDTVGTLSYAIQQANITAGNDTITLNSNVRLTGVMKSSINSNINIVGNGRTISGDTNGNNTVDAGDVRPLFILSGTVNIDNLTITNGLAQGGNGRGGGGAGMGGALFIYDGNVSLSNVALNNNQARGGSGYGYSSGGSAALTGGNEGFGRGGGSGSGSGGSGGFGGGGGEGNYYLGYYGSGGSGGFGGGKGNIGLGSGGGGGAGMGGGIFVRSGSLNLSNTTFANNITTGGIGGNNGQGLGGAIFIMSSTTNTNGNNQGMPTTVPIVTAMGSPTFTGNNAANDTNTATDNDNVFGTLTITNAAPVNILPAAQIINEDTQLAITGISVNDVDGNLATTKLTVSSGTLNIALNGATISAGGNNSSTLTLAGSQAQINATLATLRYQGNLNFNGTDNLTILSTDSAGITDSDTVRIAVTAVNDAPVGSPTATLSNTAEDTPIIITAASLLAGFSDVDGDTLSIIRVEATNGSLVNNNNGTYTFTPNANFNGVATLTYWVGDGTTTLDGPARSFTVTPVNDAPTGSPTATLINSAEDTAVTITTASLLAGFNDVDGNTLSVTNLVATNGSLVNNNNGTYTFNPNANFNGTVTLTYGVTDGTATLAGQTRSFTVTPVNDAPIGSPTAILPNTAEDTAINITAASLLAGFSDPDGNPLSVTNLVATNGSLVNNNNGTYIFNPNNNFNGVVTLTYGVTDGTVTLAGQTRSFTVTPVNDAPIGSPTATLSSTAEDTAITITAANLLAGFSDPDGNPLSVTNLVATNGNLANNNNGTYTFNPNANFNGSVTLTYGVTDGTTTLAGQDNKFVVTPVNDAPILQQPITDQRAGQNQAFTFTIPVNSFIDVDAGDALTYSVTQENGSPLPSWLIFNPITRIFAGTPTSANVGILNIKVTATDNAGAKASDVFTLSIGGDIIGTELADNLIGTNGDDNIIGLGGNDTIDGREGNDTIRGGYGNDVLNGGDGDDTFLVSVLYEGNDIYNGGNGKDTIKAQNSNINIELAGDFGVANSIEEITANGNTGINVFGDANNNILDFTNTILTNVVVNGASGNDTITGNSQANTLGGGYGNDVLNGGDGDDTFLVSVLYEGNDIYNGGNGKDTIKAQNSNINIELAGDFGVANSIEEITANGNTGITVFGDGNNNILDFTNTVLTNVVVNGASGNDTITGNSQANTLGGGYGNDVLNGGDGDDTFLVSVLYEGNDIYNGGNGKDTIKAQNSNINIELAGNFDASNSIEEITANGNTGITVFGDGNNNILDFTNTILTNVVVNGASGNDTITGNSQANTLSGGDGNDSLDGGAENDVLDGGSGNDTLIGGLGNDIYIVDWAGDVVVETSTLTTEIDTVRSAVSYILGANLENLTLTGSTATTATGNQLNNIITGNSLNNTLTGGAGVDTFVLNKTSADTITDFATDEKLQISASEFGGLTAGNLAATQLLVGAGATAATTAAQRFIFNTTDKSLYFDSDGLNGSAAVKIGVLAGLPTLNSSNFSIVA